MTISALPELWRRSCRNVDDAYAGAARYVVAGRPLKVEQAALGETEQQDRRDRGRDGEQVERHRRVCREVGCAARETIAGFVNDPPVTRDRDRQTHQWRLGQVALRDAFDDLRGFRLGRISSAGGSAAHPVSTIAHVETIRAITMPISRCQEWLSAPPSRFVRHVAQRRL